jgi:hypothetical protein
MGSVGLTRESSFRYVKKIYKIRLWKWACPCIVWLCRGTWSEGVGVTEREVRPCSLRTLREMKKMTLEAGISLLKGIVGEISRWALFNGDFEGQIKQLLQGKPTNEHNSLDLQ